MKTAFLWVLLVSIPILPEFRAVHFSDSFTSKEFAGDAKFLLHPNPATTEVNIEFKDRSLENETIHIKDMSGRKLVVLPVKGREHFLVKLDKRFVPGNYVVEVIKEKKKISRSFSVIE